MIRQFGRILRTPKHRLLYRVFAWDCQLNNSGQLKTWSSEIKSILSENHLGHLYEQQQIFSVPEIVSKLKISMFKKQKVNLKNECETKPKLRTFVTFKNFETLPPHVGKPLSFFERKILSKLRLGILPIRLETGRYLRPVLPEAQRLCYCNSGEVESNRSARNDVVLRGISSLTTEEEEREEEL